MLRKERPSPMSAKKVAFAPAIPRPKREIEDFVAAGSAAQEAVAPPLAAPASSPSSAEETKRLTIDIPESLHKRLRYFAAADGRRLADIVRELLDKNLPKV